MFTPKTLSFDLGDATQKLYLESRTDYLKHGFSYSGASLWNDLPEELCTTKSLDVFKQSISKWLSTPTRQICKPVDRKCYILH